MLWQVFAQEQKMIDNFFMLSSVKEKFENQTLKSSKQVYLFWLKFTS